jgi:hypothetical protein
MTFNKEYICSLYELIPLKVTFNKRNFYWITISNGKAKSQFKMENRKSSVEQQGPLTKAKVGTGALEKDKFLC